MVSVFYSVTGVRKICIQVLLHIIYMVFMLYEVLIIPSQNTCTVKIEEQDKQENIKLVITSFRRKSTQKTKR